MTNIKEYLALAGMVGTGLTWSNKSRLRLAPIKKKASDERKAKRKIVQASRRKNRNN